MLPVPSWSPPATDCLPWCLQFPSVPEMPSPGFQHHFNFLIFLTLKKKVSELSVKCVFGLRRRERIARAIFPKRAPKVTQQKLLFFYYSFATWALHWPAQGVQGSPKRCRRSAHWELKVAKCVLQQQKWLPQTCHKRCRCPAKVPQKRRKA